MKKSKFKRNKVTTVDGNGVVPQKTTHRSEAERCEDLRRALRETRWSLRQSGRRGVSEGKGFVTTTKSEYEEMILKLRQAVHEILPADATVLVVSKGDPQLLKLDDRRTLHFPQDAKGAYAGYYPPDSTEAIRHLEHLREEGADYIVFPATAFWWLDHYRHFRRHLENNYRMLLRSEGVCAVFAIRDRQETAAAGENGGVEYGQEIGSEITEEAMRLELAAAWSSLGRAEEARALLREGLSLQPDSRALLIALAKLELTGGDAEGAAHLIDRAAKQWPHDYAVNMALAQLAWHRNDLDQVERNLTGAADALPGDPEALNELTRLFCTRLETPEARCDAAFLERFLAHLNQPDRHRTISPETHLRIAESLGSANLLDAAFASLRTALAQLDFNSETLQAFLFRTVSSIVPDRSAVSFKNRRALAAFLTHSGNGFRAVQDFFKAETCYHLAIAAEDESWKDGGSGAAGFNLAFSSLARGDVLGVLQHLSKSTRLYPDESARIIWPAQADRLWPQANFNLQAAFEKLKSAQAAWPKITVLTPSYNQAAHLEETLLSVFNQHYPSLEYIVLDGESTDGSIEILRRYESRLSKLIVERDNGQAAALNAGLQLASGELILWVNSDDMLGPGALFMLGLAFLEEESDIIAGFCCEHADHRFQLINLPAATQATFHPEYLGEIFDYWLKGHYFYQPEVAFSRRILNKVGGSLDQNLHYTMDYEFWLRCAAAGARLSIIHWPVGFFRRHREQKTADMDNTVIEQAQVRDRFMRPQPNFERKLEIKRRVQRVFAASVPKVKIVSTRASKIFSADTGLELRETFPELDIEFHDRGEGLEVGDADLLILLVHLFKEREWLRQVRDEGYDGPTVGWFWDNHHHIFENYRATADLDFCIPGHAWAGSYLRSRKNLLLESIPLCVTQWTKREAESFFTRYGAGRRSNDLYGGFVNYDMAKKRNRLVKQLIDDGHKAIHLINEATLPRYFGLAPGEKFQTWTAHKVSICLPLNGDLSQRLFDALLAGQVPIIPPDMRDLDSVIPPQLQKQLPVVRFPQYTAKAVQQAHVKAISLFDRDGKAGVLRRHRYVLQNHMFSSRIRTILSAMCQEAK
jgi:tetratricopeptide (TPR) repeat protein